MCMVLKHCLLTFNFQKEHKAFNKMEKIIKWRPVDPLVIKKTILSHLMSHMWQEVAMGNHTHILLFMESHILSSLILCLF